MYISPDKVAIYRDSASRSGKINLIAKYPTSEKTEAANPYKQKETAEIVLIMYLNSDVEELDNIDAIEDSMGLSNIAIVERNDLTKE